jgi:RND family efflux transporter MFP subunit
MKSFFKRHKWIILVAIAILLVGYFVFGHKSEEVVDTRTAMPGDFLQEVSVSGKVVASEDVDLAFAESGRVTSISVKVGDHVVAGQALVSLSLGTLAAQLASAQADLALKRAETSNTVVNLAEVRKQQDTLVASAYRQLLSEGLAAVPSSDSVTATPPVITGSYSGPEGRYKVVIRRQSSGSDYELRTFELETTPPREILEFEPTALGTRGLYLSLPDNNNVYSDTVWYINIPNQKSTDYLANFNQYQEALRTRDREIANAESELVEGRSELSVAQAEISRAQAEVSRIQAEIAERTVRAPFAGIITDVPAKVGSIASANDPAVSMISAGALELESFVPEINVSLIKVGDPAVVTLDAYGSDVPFEAHVISVDPAETIRDGVSTYRAKLAFTTQDERIKSGMTANIVITTEEKTNVITVPRGIVIDREGKKFVLVQAGDERVEREVTVGSISSLGEIEIISGLEPGDVVVLSNE